MHNVSSKASVDQSVFEGYLLTTLNPWAPIEQLRPETVPNFGQAPPHCLR